MDYNTNREWVKDAEVWIGQYPDMTLEIIHYVCKNKYVVILSDKADIESADMSDLVLATFDSFDLAKKFAYEYYVKNTTEEIWVSSHHTC
jgi:hypothetical protein